MLSFLDLLIASTETHVFELRDSAGFILNEMGMIILPMLNYSDTLNRLYENGNLTRFCLLTHDQVSTQVPAGAFQTVDFKGHIYRDPLPNCPGNIGCQHNRFAEGIGLVRATYWYSL